MINHVVSIKGSISAQFNTVECIDVLADPNANNVYCADDAAYTLQASKASLTRQALCIFVLQLILDVSTYANVEHYKLLVSKQQVTTTILTLRFHYVCHHRAVV